MAEELNLPATLDRKEIYQSLIPQIIALTEPEPDLIANLSNIAAALKQAFGFFWVGFYLVKGNELVLGPFQGPVACTRIAFGKGVCGTAWKEEQTIIVPDVDLFPGHIACSGDSRSEIVVPIFQDSKLTMVMDIDSDKVNDFSEIDKLFLERLISVLW